MKRVEIELKGKKLQKKNKLTTRVKIIIKMKKRMKTRKSTLKEKQRRQKIINKKTNIKAQKNCLETNKEKLLAVELLKKIKNQIKNNNICHHQF